MKQLTFLLVCLSFTTNVFAGLPEKFLERYTEAKECYTRGISQEGDDAITSLQLANKKFEQCLTACEIAGSVLWDKEDLKSRISKCETEIRRKREEQKAKQEELEDKQKKLEAMKKAERERLAKEEEEKRKKQEEELEAKKQKRIQDKLVYVSSDAYVFDNKTSMHSKIKGELFDAGFRVTDNPESAYWSVFITAAAYEDRKDGFVYKQYYSAMRAIVKITNEITGGVYETEMDTATDTNGIRKWGETYKESADKIYPILTKKIGELVVEKIKTLKP